MKTILFDLDGTLIDSTQAILEGFEVAYATFNQPVPSAYQVTSLIGYPLESMFAQLGVPQEHVLEYVKAYKAHYKIISKQQTTLLPFAKEAILSAHKIANLGIVTTKTAQYSQDLLEHLGIMQYFNVLIGRESVEHPKPHPEPILKAIEALEARIESTWMIGDTILDLVAAQKAGVHGVGVLCGYGQKKELLKHTKILFPNAKEAITMIASL